MENLAGSTQERLLREAREIKKTKCNKKNVKFLNTDEVNLVKTPRIHNHLVRERTFNHLAKLAR